MDLDKLRKHYGILIVAITFVSRVIFIGFCWSYGTIMVRYKKQNSHISDTELSWIGSIGQSFGGLLASLILFLARRYGYQLIFILSLFTCVISLLISSTIHNLHWLLITYSFPYGFANAAIFILGTLICGLYYPANQDSKHILVMCIISTGFPIGYHIMSALIFSSIEQNGWQSMTKRIAFIEVVATCILGPLFTTKYLSIAAPGYHRPSITVATTNQRRSYFSLPIIMWMLGIFTTMSAVNNFLLHLHSHLESLLIAPARADLWFRLHGLFDALFRLLIPLFIRLYPIDIIYLFPICVLSGFVFLLLIFGLLYASSSLNALAILPIVLFSFTSAVTTSLQYTVSNQLFSKDQTEQGYVYHVIITSLGSIIGPVIGGLFLDLTGSYKSIILTSMIFLLISFISFGVTILLSNKKKMNESEQNTIH